MLAKRIIPCLSVANGRVQNGVQFRDMVDAAILLNVRNVMRYKERTNLYY